MTTKERILEIINSELNIHNQSMPSLIARENIATKINFLFEQELSEQKPEKTANVNYTQIRDLTDEEWLKLPKEEILQLYKNCYDMLWKQFQKPEINLRDEHLKLIKWMNKEGYLQYHLHNRIVNEYLKQTKR